MKIKLLTASIIFFAAMGFMIAACKKYKDPPPSSGDDRLTNKYCNDPRAINYNWGFPGIPDSASCIFPIDKFVGNWVFTDTVYLPDSTISSIDTKQLNFTSTEDTMRAHMAVTGLCSNNSSIKITADRFHTALTDTLIQYSNGAQTFCSNADTVMGSFVRDDSIASIKINLTEMDEVGTKYHTGIAVKQ